MLFLYVSHMYLHWRKTISLLVLIMFFSLLASSVVASENQAGAANLKKKLNEIILLINKGLIDDPDISSKLKELKEDGDRIATIYDAIVDKNPKLDGTLPLLVKEMENSVQSITSAFNANKEIAICIENTGTTAPEQLNKSKNNIGDVKCLVDTIADDKKIIDGLYDLKHVLGKQVVTIFDDIVINNSRLNEILERIERNVKFIASALGEKHPELLDTLRQMFTDIIKEAPNYGTLGLFITDVADVINDIHGNGFVQACAQAFVSKLMESSIKAGSSENPTFHYLGMGIFPILISFNYNLLVTGEVGSIAKTESFASMLGKAAALALIKDEKIFFPYLKARLYGNAIRKVVGSRIANDKLFSLPMIAGWNSNALIRELIAGAVELFELSLIDSCNTSGMIIEAILATNTAYKIFPAAATPMGAAFIAYCKNKRHAEGKRGFEDFLPPLKPKYACVSQLSDFGSSCAICDNKIWQVMAIHDGQVSFNPDVGMVSFPALNKNNGSSLMDVRRGENEYEVVAHLIYFWIQSLYQSFFSILGIHFNTREANFPSFVFYVNLLRTDFSFTNSILSTPARELCNYFRYITAYFSPSEDYNVDSYIDLQRPYTIKSYFYGMAMGGGNLGAFTLDKVKTKNDVATLTLSSHVLAGNIKITEVTSVEGDICRPQSPLPEIGPRGKKTLVLTNCPKGVPHSLRTKYIIGNDITGEYLQGMIWFRDNDDRQVIAIAESTVKNKLLVSIASGLDSGSASNVSIKSVDNKLTDRSVYGSEEGYGKLLVKADANTDELFGAMKEEFKLCFGSVSQVY